ncbi:MAG: PqqD family protein [Candidatus Omnitrophota bacterium]|nr:PqqD family protein [Candidatus Omnitrophota bacterium]
MIFFEHVKIREEKFGAVVFETLKEKVFVTNETGKNILNLLKEGKSVEEIINSLADLYAVEPEDIKDDVLGFVGLLKEKGILVAE